MKHRYTVVPVVLTYLALAVFIIVWLIRFFKSSDISRSPLINIIAVFFILALAMPAIAFLIFRLRAGVELRKSLGLSCFFGLAVVGGLVGTVLFMSITDQTIMMGQNLGLSIQYSVGYLFPLGFIFFMCYLLLKAWTEKDKFRLL